MKSLILSDLEILFNFDMGSNDKTVILHVGLPLIISTLSLNVNETFKQRIVMSYQLAWFTKYRRSLNLLLAIYEMKNDVDEFIHILTNRFCPVAVIIAVVGVDLFIESVIKNRMFILGDVFWNILYDLWRLVAVFINDPNLIYYL